MQHKITTKLFNGTYQYKIVLICAGASLFRCKDIDTTLVKLNLTNVAQNLATLRSNKIRTTSELAYALQLANTIKRLGDDVELRVQSPWISIYTNNKAAIDTIINLGESNVKYISSPPAGTKLESGTIIMSKRDYDYRITLGATHQVHDTFIQWADSNGTKLKLTNSCRKDLLKEHSWGGSYFYLTGDNVLLMAKLHLGSSILKIEKIVTQ